MRQHLALRLEVPLGAAIAPGRRHQEDASLTERVEALVRYTTRLFRFGCPLREHRDQRGGSINHGHGAILLGTVGSFEIDVALAIATIDADAPRIAARLAVLDERATHVGLDVDLDFLSAVRTGDGEGVVHSDLLDGGRVFLVVRRHDRGLQSNGDWSRWELHAAFFARGLDS